MPSEGNRHGRVQVLTERDVRLLGSFDPESLEAILTSYATGGWRLAEGFVATNVWKSLEAAVGGVP
ncbi:MAG: hypothetical protein JWQ07_5519 [Ramlibacter sp.]|nr:hypothetical protein [Ramlibacter sp.]